MKELDLTNAKYLKKWLSLVYRDWEMEGIKDICSLTRSVIFASIINFLGLLILLCGVFILLLCLVPFTLLLPNSLQFIPLPLLNLGVIALTILIFFSLMVSISATLNGDMKFAPDYITKHFKSGTELKEKNPSQTWTAIKEMYASFKDKTCIKVKMK